MVVSASRLPTEFAPAERAPQNEIVNQAAAFGRHTVTVQLLDAIPDAFLILDQHRQAVFANQTLLDMLGVAGIEDVLGLRPGEMLGCVHASKTPGGCGTTEFCRNCGAVAAILSGLKGKCDVQECWITQKDGTALDLRVWSTPFQFEQTQYTVFAVKDIGDEKRRRALERVFFHDVLNTATIISGYVQLLEANPEDAEMVAAEMTHIVERLVGEINTQRDLTAAENGELDVHFSMIDPLMFLQGIQQQYERHPVAVDRHIVINTQQAGVMLYTDRILLERVIGNMVKNALEASSPGGTVTLSFSERI